MEGEFPNLESLSNYVSFYDPYKMYCVSTYDRWDERYIDIREVESLADWMANNVSDEAFVKSNEVNWVEEGF